jgi:methylated-DNA-[protein]-cysteine S-methyltransferase
MNRSETTLPALGDTSALSRATMPSPVGELTLIASPRGLRAVLWPNELAQPGRLPMAADGDPDAAKVLREAVLQLEEYFAGDRREFDLPLDPVGTDFQQSAWLQLRRIPYGATISYGEQARRLGDVRKSRAVGAANGRNPISIISVPSSGGCQWCAHGFAAGLEAKPGCCATSKHSPCRLIPEPPVCVRLEPAPGGPTLT